MDENIISQRLRDIRVEHNLKQEDIAKVLGLDRSAYSGYETGRSKISVKNLCKLSDIYNVTLGQLVGKTEENEVVKVKISSVSNAVDPIAMLDREEQLLLMYFRLADDEKKNAMFEFLASKTEKDEDE